MTNIKMPPFGKTTSETSDLPENLNAKKLFCYFARKQSAKRLLLKFNGSGGRKKLNSVRGLRIVAQVAGAEQISAHLLNLPDLPDLQPEKYLHIEPCTHMEHLLIPFCICRHLYSFKKGTTIKSWHNCAGLQSFSRESIWVECKKLPCHLLWSAI